jgi:hypothetical protein
MRRSLSKSNVRTKVANDEVMVAALEAIKARVTVLRTEPSPTQDLGSEYWKGAVSSRSGQSSGTHERRFTSSLVQMSNNDQMTSRLSEGVIGRQTYEGSSCGADAETMLAPWDLRRSSSVKHGAGKDWSKPWMVVGPAGEPAHGWTPGRNDGRLKENNHRHHREVCRLTALYNKEPCSRPDKLCVAVRVTASSKNHCSRVP